MSKTQIPKDDYPGVQDLNTDLIKGLTAGSFDALLLFDLDQFQLVNKTYGRKTGDRIIYLITEFLNGSGFKWYRIGGEEFALLLPNTSAEGARALAEKIVNEIAVLDLNSVAPKLQMTVSIGIAVYRKNISAKTLLKEADEYLYEAKHAGRNRFCG